MHIRFGCGTQHWSLICCLPLQGSFNAQREWWRRLYNNWVRGYRLLFGYRNCKWSWMQQLWRAVYTRVAKQQEQSIDISMGIFNCMLPAARLTFRHRASCILGQAFHYSPENASYIFNQQIYFIIWYLLDRASLI